MRLMVLSPNTSEELTLAIKKTAEEVKSVETDVVCINPSSGPRSIESDYDELLSCVPSLEVII